MTSWNGIKGIKGRRGPVEYVTEEGAGLQGLADLHLHLQLHLHLTAKRTGRRASLACKEIVAGR